MGRVVTFSALDGRAAEPGVSIAPVTAGDTKEMAAELVRLAPGREWRATAPAGSDCYLFALTGGASISAGDGALVFAPQTFATVGEGVAFAVRNDGVEPAEILKVIAPPQPRGTLAGLAPGIAVVARAAAETVDLPAEKKTRIYFAGHQHGARTERGHAMIVVYQQDTATPLHHHPNAESMFVLLDGALEFTVNGRPVTVEPGQAVYFATHDKHALHVAAGHKGASFLEFHIPGAFTTVRE
jgi:mannose-6-phosphate isomerase-like protein (cupin superfamily)